MKKEDKMLYYGMLLGGFIVFCLFIFLFDTLIKNEVVNHCADFCIHRIENLSFSIGQGEI